jgi:2-methylcitrate dehydratase PrpD
LITAEVCEFTSRLRLEDIPADTVRVCRRHLLDTCGVMLSGRREPTSALATHHARLLASGAAQLPAPPAAFVLGLRGHVDDYDDTQLSTRPQGVYGLLTHPSVPVLAAALTCAQAEGSSGAEVLTAFIGGTEAECRISDAINPRHYREGFHSSGTVGTLGACLAAARVMGLDPERTQVALGIAASSAAGLRENFGTMTKSLHVGRAAQHGVEAAFLARAGYTAATGILEAGRGFFGAFGGGFDPALIHGRLGRPWFYIEPGVSIKPHPGGSLTHPAMWAMLQLCREHDLKPEAVEKVMVGTSSAMPNALIHHRPRDPLAAKFSMEYSIATILARRRAGLPEYTEEAVLDPSVQDLIPRVELVVDPEAEAAGFHRMLSLVEVRLRDGSVVRGSSDAGRGHPDNPMSDDEVVAKFRECAAWAELGDWGEEVRGLVDQLERLPNVEPLVTQLIGS